MERKREKGFTIVEILVSFSLAIIVLIYIFNVLSHLKNLYTEDGIRSQLLVKQSGIVRAIEKALSGKRITTISSVVDASGRHGHRIALKDRKNSEESSVDLFVDNGDNKMIYFGEQKVEFIKGTDMGIPEVKVVKTKGMPEGYNNAVAFITVTVKHHLVEGDYGVRVVYPFDDRVDHIPDIDETAYVSVSLKGYAQNREHKSGDAINQNIQLQAKPSPLQNSKLGQYTYQLQKLENGSWKNVSTSTQNNFDLSAEQNATYRVFLMTEQKDAFAYSNPYIAFIDKTKPSCNIVANGMAGENGWYKEKSVSLSLTRNDNSGGSGIATYGFSKTATKTYNKVSSGIQTDTSGTTWYGYVKDQAGNENNCQLLLKVDTKKPTCNIKVTGTTGNNGWYKLGNVTLDLTRSDNSGGSGISTYDLSNSSSKTYSERTSGTQSDTNGTTWYGYVKDTAGNESTCSTAIKVDTKAPKCTTSASTNKWTNQDVVVTTKCIDSGSGCTKSNVKYTYTTNSGTIKNVAAANGWGHGGSDIFYDNAGNIGLCNAHTTVKIDKAPPTISETTTGLCTKSNPCHCDATLSVSASDQGGGIYKIERQKILMYNNTIFADWSHYNSRCMWGKPGDTLTTSRTCTSDVLKEVNDSGEYINWKWRVTDSAGNQTTIGPRQAYNYNGSKCT